MIHSRNSRKAVRGDCPRRADDDRAKELNMNKFEEVKMLAEELECDYDTAFCLVYDIWGDPEETDDAL